MIFFLLGLVTGFFLGSFLAFLAVAFGSHREGQVKRLVDNLGKTVFPPQQAEFLAPREADAEAIAEVIKQDEEKGDDTDIEEL